MAQIRPRMDTRKINDEASTGSKSSPWLWGAKTDLLIGAGLWSLPLIVGTVLLSTYYGAGMAMLFYAFALVCNNPHYMATIYRAYGNSNEVNKYRLFTVYVTALVLLLGLSLHFVPRWVPWVYTLYLFWSPWHYTGQNYGILMMLCGRHGARPTGRLRWLIYGSFIISYLLWLLAKNAIQSDDYRVITLGLSNDWVNPLLIGGCCTYAIMVLIAIWLMKIQIGMRATLIGGALLFTQTIWFVVPIVFT